MYNAFDELGDELAYKALTERNRKDRPRAGVMRKASRSSTIDLLTALVTLADQNGEAIVDEQTAQRLALAGIVQLED